MASVSAYLRKNRQRNLDELIDLLRIPSISTDPGRNKDVRKAAQFVKKHLADSGCTKTELIDTPGHPIVYGEWMKAPKGAPTVLVYGHYDVQPPEPLDLWETPPFEPTIRKGKLFARGSADDKGQYIIHPNALRAHLETNGTCPVNVKFLIEGEEEIGSPNLDPFIKKNLKKLKCDVVVISDTHMMGKKTPSICHGLRGLAYLEIEVTGTKADLHSGTFGGAVVNPANALVEMLATLKDARGKIKVHGFYDDVRKLTPKERREYKKLPHDDEKYRRSLGAPALWGEKGFSTLERISARPTLDINGIWGGYQGEGAKTVIPAKAYAKISCRLVPDQDSKDIAKKVQAYLKLVSPDSVKVKVKSLHGGEAWVAPTDHPALQAGSRAFKRAFGKDALFTREGGSIPVVATFDKLMKVPTVLLGIGLPDDGLHAPNEKMDVDQFHRGTEAAAYLLEELAR
ncbi:hypothetical protein ABI59_09375 [Acidobacteria bacterium Mor1]|nr:hypothetical protein ABI59_09375 [Acidobacteria bacterium Mor1]